MSYNIISCVYDINFKLNDFAAKPKHDMISKIAEPNPFGKQPVHIPCRSRGRTLSMASVHIPPMDFFGNFGIFWTKPPCSFATATTASFSSPYAFRYNMSYFDNYSIWCGMNKVAERLTVTFETQVIQNLTRFAGCDSNRYFASYCFEVHHRLHVPMIWVERQWNQKPEGNNT